MNIACWIAIGVLMGLFTSMLYGDSCDDYLLDILLGILGATVGGWILVIFSSAAYDRVNLYSLLAAIVGAVAVLWVCHTAVARRILR